jgi:hypothetical protein
MSEIRWLYYPKSRKPTALVLNIVQVFQSAHYDIDSQKFELPSNSVLSRVKYGLEELGFAVEAGKTRVNKIQVPVLYGQNGKLEKWFDADAYHRSEGFVVEVEAGRAVVNYQFLKDFFQACMMNEVRFLAIAVRTVYRNRNDFDIVLRFFDTLYASNRLEVPLEGILIIGY